MVLTLVKNSKFKGYINEKNDLIDSQSWSHIDIIRL